MTDKKGGRQAWGMRAGTSARGKDESTLSPQIAMQSLWNIKVAVLVKPEHENRVSHVSTSSVKTGIANTLGEQSGWAPEGGVLLLTPPVSSPGASTSRGFRILTNSPKEDH